METYLPKVLRNVAIVVSLDTVVNGIGSSVLGRTRARRISASSSPFSNFLLTSRLSRAANFTLFVYPYDGEHDGEHDSSARERSRDC